MMDFFSALKAGRIGIGGADDHWTRLFAEKAFKKQQKATIYGWHVNPDESDPYTAVTYLEDAVGMAPAAMGGTAFSYGSWADAFFLPKPCMLKSDGTVAYYLDPDDYTKKADGTASDVADDTFDGNAMMEWPMIWFKFVAGEAEGEGSFYVSDQQADEDYRCWCNIDSKNNIIPNFYTAIYQGTGTSKMRSLSGIALTTANGNGGTTTTQEVTRATANNETADVEWYTEVYSDRQLITALLTLITKNLNGEAIGRGIDTGSQEAKEAYISGTLNDKGQFWGDQTGTNGVKIFGMENWWGLVWHRIAGLITNDLVSAYKMTYGTADGSTADGYNQTGAGYLTGPTLPNTNNYLKTQRFGEYGLLPETVEGTGTGQTAYYCDYYYQSTGTRYVRFGGVSGSGRYAGPWYLNVNGAPGNSHWTIAASLSCKPLRKG